MAYQGFCIRLKAVLPVATPSGSQSLLVNAVRGKPAEFQIAAWRRFQFGLDSLATPGFFIMLRQLDMGYG